MSKIDFQCSRNQLSWLNAHIKKTNSPFFLLLAKNFDLCQKEKSSPTGDEKILYFYKGGKYFFQVFYMSEN
jgi:hypothetical protein